MLDGQDHIYKGSAINVNSKRFERRIAMRQALLGYLIMSSYWEETIKTERRGCSSQ